MRSTSVSVGQLIQLCRRGDINFRFSNRSTAIEGIRGHQKIQKSRGTSYVAEHAVTHTVTSGETELVVNGRIDGYGVNEDGCFIDEIKTIRVGVDEIPDGVMESYWLQVTLYGYMLACELELKDLVTRLCFYHLEEKTEYILERNYRINDLTCIFMDTTKVFLDLQEQQRMWQTQRAVSLESISFPYGDYRPGQRDMAVSVYRAVHSNEQLIVQAPTGIGKTMATLFPAVKALEPEKINRIFYLSAKSSTQALAQIAVRDIGNAGARLRSVVITAKDKICFNPGEPCDPEHCQFARGYYDRITQVIDEMLRQHDQFDRAMIEEAAQKHSVCPFELELDLSRHCDVIIADFNYVFDPVVYLRRYFENNKPDSIALVDEAHNLVDRGREMFSASVQKSHYLSLAELLKNESRRLHLAAKSVNQAILDYKKQDKKAFELTGHIKRDTLPLKVLEAMTRFCGAAEEQLRDEQKHGWREPLLQCYFDTLRFIRTAENFANDYVTLLEKSGKHIRLRLYCVDPSRQLQEGFDRLSAAVCFSATLQPKNYFQRMLGIRDESKWYRLASPFPRENLQVCVAGFIDTSYKGRSDSLQSLVDLIDKTIGTQSGNYLVFFPSHEYLKNALLLFESTYPHIHVIAQQREMTDQQRQKFINSFDHRPVLGFAVMGGVFSEGIDLKGNKLIGVIVVGVGLPQVGIERDLIKAHFPEAGFEYAYLLPGLIRVLQTAGRVIRGSSDKGIICLVDRRYLESRYRNLLPVEWDLQSCSGIKDLEHQYTRFWSPKK